MKEGRRDSWGEIREIERWRVRCMKERGVLLMKALHSPPLLSNPSFPPGHFTLFPPSSSQVIAEHHVHTQKPWPQQHAKE